MISFFHSKPGKEAYLLIPVFTNYTTIQPDQSSQPHVHSVYHVIFVISDQGALETDAGVFPLRPHDIVLVNPKSRHIFHTGRKSLHYFAFNFYLIPYEYCRQWHFHIERFGQNRNYLERSAEKSRLEDLWSLRVDQIYIGYPRQLWHEITKLIVKGFRDFQGYVRSPVPSEPQGFLQYTADANRFFAEVLDLVQRGNDHGRNKEWLDPLVGGVAKYVRHHLSDKYSLRTLAHRVGYAPAYLCDYFKSHTGMTINEYFYRSKIQKACELLKMTGKTVTQVAFELGFSSSQHFSNRFKSVKKMTPKEYQRNLEFF